MNIHSYPKIVLLSIILIYLLLFSHKNFSQNIVCKGIITKNGFAVSDVYISVYKNNNIISMTYSNSKGNYILFLKPEGEYQIKLFKKGFKDIIFNFSAVGLKAGDEVIKNIEYDDFYPPILSEKIQTPTEINKKDIEFTEKTDTIAEIENDITIIYKGKVISKNKPIEKAKVKLLLNGVPLEDAITNKKGEFSFVLYPNLKYMIMILKEGYLVGYDEIETSLQNKEISKRIELNPIEQQK